MPVASSVAIKYPNSCCRNEMNRCGTELSCASQQRCVHGRKNSTERSDADSFRESGWGRDDAELHHHAEGVHEDAAVGHAGVDEAVDDDAFDRDGAAGGGDAEEVAALCAGPGEAGDDLFAGGDGFVGDPMDVGECGAHHGDDLFEAFAALALARERVELDKVFGNDLVADLVAALVDDFVDEALDDGGVVGWHAAPVMCERQGSSYMAGVKGDSYLAGSRPKDLSCCWMAGLVSQLRKSCASFCWLLALRMTPACRIGGYASVGMRMKLPIERKCSMLAIVSEMRPACTLPDSANWAVWAMFSAMASFGRSCALRPRCWSACWAARP